MIKTNCPKCGASFELKDELAGKKAKCPNCETIFQIPNNNENTINTEKKEENSEIKNKENFSTEEKVVSEKTEKKGIFSQHIYGIKQKKIAINEKYFIRDKDNNDLLFSLREAKIMRGLFSALVFIAIIILSFFIGFALTAGNEEKIFIYLIPVLIIGFSLATFLAMFVSPLRHIKFFKSIEDSKNKESLFEIKEDSKFQLLNKTYTMKNNEGKIICKFRKNMLTDIFRKKWNMEFAGKKFEIKEDSVILSILRRIMPYGNFIRTNFVFIDTESGENLGIFKRKFEIFDNYLLDLSKDISYKIPRQLAVGMAVLLDTGEKR